MPNPFTSTREQNNNVPRNSHDLSYQNNITLPFGKLIPAFIQEVFEGNSIEIEPTFGLRTLPMVFPVQTRMKVRMHYFYVRNRTLWKDWMDFKFGTKTGLVPPTLGKSSPVSFGVSSLSDYLNVPTQLYTDQSFSLTYKYAGIDGTVVNGNTVTWPLAEAQDMEAAIGRRFDSIYNTNAVTSSTLSKYHVVALAVDASIFQSMNPDQLKSVKLRFTCRQRSSTGAIAWDKVNSWILTYDSSGVNLPNIMIASSISSDTNTTYIEVVADLTKINSSAAKLVFYCQFTTGTLQPMTGTDNFIQSVTSGDSKYNFPNGVDLDTLGSVNNPFINGKRPLVCLPYRAYEAIYNSFYRKQLIDPFKIDGQIEYNKFIPNDDGGEDNYEYTLHNSYYEDDAFTSCLPSPQQGPTPLVGIVDAVDSKALAFQDEDGHVHRVSFTRDKTGITGINVSDPTNDVITYTLDDITTGLLAAKQGITINDFRNVNALQKYLELNQRKGFRYKDLVKGHYDVDIRYEELNYPEFIGGFSRELYVNSVTATAATGATENSPEIVLGDYAGQGGLSGQGERFSKYCDENGFVIGIMSVTPVPVYTQTLPKYFTKLSQFDHFSPEFANLGMQPITKDLVCPLQYYLSNPPEDDPDFVFGYQRPWWEYVQSTDQAHGLFRSSLRNFLLHRVFDAVPALSRNFIECQAEQLNDIFATSMENGDKLLGEIYHKVTVKSAVPYVSIPQLD